MASTYWWIIDIILPVVLLIALVSLVFLRRSRGTSHETYEATKEEYAEEEHRRRKGADGL